MNLAYLRSGNTQLGQVLSYDPKDAKDSSQMFKYLKNEPVSRQPEAHILGYESLVNRVSSHIEDNGVVFVAHGNTSSADAAKKESSNIALLIKSVYGQLKAKTPQGKKVMLNLALDLLPTNYQHGLERYLKGEIKEKEFLKDLTPEYQEKAKFASELLKVAKRYGIEVIAIDSKPGARDPEHSHDPQAAKDAKTYRMARLIPTKTIVIAYEDLVRNSATLPVKVENRHRALGTKILRISQNPSQGISNAAKAVTLYNGVVDLTYLNAKPVDYLLLGNISKMDPDDPVIKTETEAGTTTLYTVLKELVADPRLLDKLKSARAAALSQGRRISELTEANSRLRDGLTEEGEAKSALMSTLERINRGEDEAYVPRAVHNAAVEAAKAAQPGATAPPQELSDTDLVCRIVANQLKSLGLSLGPVLDDILENKLTSEQIDVFAATSEGQEYIRLIEKLKGAQ